MQNIEINQEIIIPLIDDLKADTRDQQMEVMQLLDISSAVAILIKMNETLQTKKDNQVTRLAIVTYGILLKRVNNMMRNPRLLCSKEDKKHINELYSTLLENNPNSKGKIRKFVKPHNNH